MSKNNERKNVPKPRMLELEEETAYSQKASGPYELRSKVLQKDIEINCEEYGVDMIKKSGIKL